MSLWNWLCTLSTVSCWVFLNWKRQAHNWRSISPQSCWVGWRSGLGFFMTGCRGTWVACTNWSNHCLYGVVLRSSPQFSGGRDLVSVCCKSNPTIRSPGEEADWGLNPVPWGTPSWLSTRAYYHRNLTSYLCAQDHSYPRMGKGLPKMWPLYWEEHNLSNLI